MKSIHSLGNEQSRMAAIELRPQTITVPFPDTLFASYKFVGKIAIPFYEVGTPITLEASICSGVFEISNLRFISLHRIIPDGSFREI